MIDKRLHAEQDGIMERKPKVLFLCTGNSARSQMGEALLRKHAGDRFEIHSAGLEPSIINPYTVRVLNEVDIDTSQQYAKPLNTYVGNTHFGYLITVCSKAEEKCPIFPGMGMRLHWPFEDPAAFEGSEEETLVKFRQVRDQVEAKVKEWVRELEQV
jgi:arsenate reductase (thioredoxin)